MPKTCPIRSVGTIMAGMLSCAIAGDKTATIANCNCNESECAWWDGEKCAIIDSEHFSPEDTAIVEPTPDAPDPESDR